MRYAIIGTGFVADYYMTTRANHPLMELAGVWDIDAARLAQFCAFHDVPSYESEAALLGDETVELIVVLTTPETHFDICSAALNAGKHVYCEKPLAMRVDDARALVALAESRGLYLGGAPANALSPAYDLVSAQLKSGAIGAPKLVYAEMEDGPVFREAWQSWRSKSGAPWPGKHEFEIGCTLEHAGYGVSWLIGLFGPICSITGYSGMFFEDKGADIAPENMAPDFSSACLVFENGVVARLTCGLCAPRDRSLTIMGEGGTLTVGDLWDSHASVHLERKGDDASFAFRLVRKLEAKLNRALPVKVPRGKRLAYEKTARQLPAYPSQIDFMAGPAQLAESVASGEYRKEIAAKALHSTEAVLVLNRLTDHGGRYAMETTL